MATTKAMRHQQLLPLWKAKDVTALSHEYSATTNTTGQLQMAGLTCRDYFRMILDHEFPHDDSIPSDPEGLPGR